jgi:hypothetical protein
LSPSASAIHSVTPLSISRPSISPCFAFTQWQMSAIRRLAVPDARPRALFPSLHKGSPPSLQNQVQQPRRPFSQTNEGSRAPTNPLLKVASINGGGQAHPMSRTSTSSATGNTRMTSRSPMFNANGQFQLPPHSTSFRFLGNRSGLHSCHNNSTGSTITTQDRPQDAMQPSQMFPMNLQMQIQLHRLQLVHRAVQAQAGGRGVEVITSTLG